LFVYSELVRESIIIISGKREGRGKSEKGVRSLFYDDLDKKATCQIGVWTGGHVNKIG
jgi:hypothetical protein